MTVQYTTWSAICPSVSESTFANCSGRMKRAATSSTTEDALEPKKRKVMYSTYEKWRRDFDHECKTVTWLGCETTEMARGKRWVKWISGADSPRTNNISDHAHSDQHQHAMSLLQREKAAVRGESASSFAPIAAALNTSSDEESIVSSTLLAF